jgi:hypothetical protein
MRYNVISNGQLIGTTLLEFHDSGMAVALGTFDPTPTYDLVRPVFLLFTSALTEDIRTDDTQKLSQYYAARDALQLALEDENGRRLATGHIHIVDWGPENDSDLEVEVQVSDPQFWKQV